MIQHLKATYFDAEGIADQIQATSSALKCKNLVRDIPNYNHEDRNNIAKEMCENGIKAKFVQNPNLQTLLLNTGKKVIAECCLDQTWGSGVPLYDDQAINQYNWIGQGILGKTLVEIRDELASELASSNLAARSTHSSVEPPAITLMDTNTEL